MSLKLLIANKNYSSWSVRPLLVLDHFQIPCELVPGATDAAAEQTVIAKYKL